MQHAWGWCMGMTHRDVMGREVGGGSCLGTHVRIKDFKIKKINKLKQTNKQLRKLNITHVVETLTNLSPVSLVPSPSKGAANLIWKFNYTGRFLSIYCLLY